MVHPEIDHAVRKLGVEIDQFTYKEVDVNVRLSRPQPLGRGPLPFLFRLELCALSLLGRARPMLPVLGVARTPSLTVPP